MKPGKRASVSPCEAVRLYWPALAGALEGELTAVSCGTEQEIRFPDCLRKELLTYARKNGYLHGPIFLTRDGKPMSRANVTTGMRQLCEAVGLPYVSEVTS